MSLTEKISDKLIVVKDLVGEFLASHEAATLDGYYEIMRGMVIEGDDREIYVGFVAGAIDHTLTILRRHRAADDFPTDEVRDIFREILAIEGITAVGPVVTNINNVLREFRLATPENAALIEIAGEEGVLVEREQVVSPEDDLDAIAAFVVRNALDEVLGKISMLGISGGGAGGGSF